MTRAEELRRRDGSTTEQDHRYELPSPYHPITHRSPFVFEHGVEVLVPPGAVGAFDTLAEVGFALHPQLLHDPAGGRILRLAGGNDPVDVERLEAIAEERLRPFCRVPLSVVVGMEDPTDLV